MVFNLKLRKKIFIIAFAFVLVLSCVFIKGYSAYAMPFYDLNPQKIVLRAQFYTSYTTSTEERKHNIALASKAIDRTLIEPNAEFSFNNVVGERTVKRGYKVSKIIVGGEFVDGVGGGVCQVSTTLYNAVLLAGLKIIEFHPHSLPVSYVAPSFDAMVNSGWADLKFINQTQNPVIIRAYADGSTLRVEIYGQPLKEKYVRKSVVTEQIPAPESEIVYDDDLSFPELYLGESKTVKYGKAGYKSEGYLMTLKNGKLTEVKKIRVDSYSATRGKIILGKAEKPAEDNGQSRLENLDIQPS